MKILLLSVVSYSVCLWLAEASSMPWYQQQPEVYEPVKYVVTYPTFIRASSPFVFNLVLFENPKYTLPVSFTAKLTSGSDRDSQVLAQQSFTQQSYGLQQHSFDTVKAAAGFSSEDSGLNVWIEFTSTGLTNQSISELPTYQSQLTEKFVFVQTDKAMYKPTQTINFRAVALDRQLMPLSGTVNVVVEDPKNNQIKAWNNQPLDRGLFGASLTLSDYVNFGEWKITYSGANIPTTEKTFTVQQYVLPKYEVKVEFSPSYWMFNADENGYEGFIRAKYTFGKSVRGKAVIRLTNTGGCNNKYDYPNGYYYDPQPTEKYPLLEFTLPLAGDGSAIDGKFSMKGKGLGALLTDKNTQVAYAPQSASSKSTLPMPACALTFQVNVTEELTGEVIRSEGAVTLYRDPYKIAVHDSVQKTLKLGLPFTMRMQVTKPDDTPVEAGVAVDVEVFYWMKNETQRYSITCYSPYYYQPDTTNEPKRLANATMSLVTDSNGLISLDVVPSKNSESTQFRATLKKYPTIQVCDTRSPPQSVSKQSLSISIDRPISMSSSIPKVGEKITFKIQASYATQYVYFMMSQNGYPFLYRKLETPTLTTADSTIYSVDVLIPAEAAPRCAAAVWTVENNAYEVLADAVDFKVDGLIKQNVSASFSPSTVKPGGQTTLSVRSTEGNSLVALLAVDKSVKLLKSGNDITLDDVLGAVGDGSSGSVSPVLWRCWRCGWWPWWIDSSNAENVFNGIGMAIRSNVRTRMFNAMPMNDGAVFAMAGAAGPRLGGDVMMDAAPMAANNKESAVAKQPAASQTVQTVRKQFPEMWIWREGQIDATGAFSLPLTAPDTITTWVLSAFAIGSRSGFGSLESPAELTVFQKFFVNLDVPYATVIRNEQFEIKGVVFNYQETAQSVALTLKSSPDFEVSTDSGKTYASVQFSTTVNVPANDGASVSIWIRPKRLGDIKMELSGVSTTDSSSADAMEKVVTVEAEGDIRYANRPIFIRFDTQKSEKYTISAADLFGNIPQDRIVQGSKFFQLQAIGDLLGPALTQLGAQIRMPMGCGEQTMVILAPNVYIYKYLKAVNSLTSELETKTVRFVESGYQRELTYQRSDGGYSAFGESDSASSTWLTAFVMRCFNAATTYVNTQIDKSIFEKSWNFIKGSAKSDGTFLEAGKVIHHSMKGGATSDDNLAAYIYTAYAETGGSNVYAWKSLSATRSKIIAIGTDSSKDPYQLALISYALSILPGDQSVSKTILNRLMSMASRDGDLMYWKPAADQSGVDDYSRSGPSQIETSAYVLLTLVNHNQLENATMVARWLMSQRNSLGGFSSTQDTVVGLQALAEFASKISSAPVKLNIAATYNFADGNQSLTSSFNIDSSNSKLLSSFDLPRDHQSLNSVDLTVTGTGNGLVQLAAKYNLVAQKVMDSGDYKIVIIQDVMARRKREADAVALSDVALQGCIMPITTQARVGMVVVELGVPTGFTADLEGTKSANGLSDYSGMYEAPVPATSSSKVASPLKRIELGDRKIVYYFDSLETTSGQTCVSGKMTRTSSVKNVQPPVARVYAYYDPVRVNSTLYSFAGMSVDDTARPQPIACAPGTQCNSAFSNIFIGDVTAAVIGLITLAVMLIAM